jgi:NAD(P)H-hydrate epimerase
MYLVSASEMQAMDRRTIESFGIPGRVLMECAGRGATRWLLNKFGDLQKKRIGVFAGRGNNGGDGFVMARYLHQKGIGVTVFLLTERKRVGGDADANLRLLEPLGVPVLEIADEFAFSDQKALMLDHDIYVDAILGTGLKSAVRGYFRQVIEFITQSQKPVLAVDIPSGINADTGQICGVAVRAAATATFAFAKHGHFQYPGANYCGDLKIIDIGIPPFITEAIGPKQWLLTPQAIGKILPNRAPDTHKGHTGHALIISGSTGKTGAAAMAAMSAMRVGAGLVTLGIPISLNPTLEASIMEAMTVPLAETAAGELDESALDAICTLLPGKRCLALGPGIGTSDSTRKLIIKLIQRCPIPMVIDADGLNCLASRVDLLKQVNVPIILTPHPGEMARLIERPAAEVQADRIACARSFSTKYQVTTVLKGAYTVIAFSDGTIRVNPSGNPGMASGGMGDVLTGMITGLIAQNIEPELAACAGVYLHGAAADEVEAQMGPLGYLATDVMNVLPAQIVKVRRVSEQNPNRMSLKNWIYDD